PFDNEGMLTRKTYAIKRGILENYLCNSYSARKLNLKSTGNCTGRGVGPNNFYLVPGKKSQEEIIKSVDKGLLVTRTIGHGFNPVTGDISRGAFGLWIEKGEIAYPVSEITISGNLGRILKDISIIGNDIDFRSHYAGPTIKIEEMTVGGI
ncbi:TldD/PmbA family protein, partial [Candidatus Aminicenantes bacterium AC-335-A11]|nr:TldD/PmbA family protein [Candidatus Aminicenantes bacterium AC-335-A11]